MKPRPLQQSHAPSGALNENKVGSKFLLVNMVSKRVKEMQETEYYQLNEYKSSKDIGKALEEVGKGLINIKEK